MSNLLHRSFNPANRENEGVDDTATLLRVHSKNSLIHIGSLDSFDITEGGKSAARHVLDYLDHRRAESAQDAIDIYDHLIPSENFGGEYTALRWLCKFFLAGEGEKQEFLTHPILESWLDLLARDDFANLREYMLRKYHFVENDKDDPEAKVKLRFLEDFILFNNPDRVRWDKTSENLDCLNLQEGFKIIDLGAGPGYFTYKFVEMIGPTGHVYVLETNERHLQFQREFIKKYKVGNVTLLEYVSNGTVFHCPEKVDLLYMCSLYHIIYAANTDGERDLLFGCIRESLKDDGRLVIVDNDLVEDAELPYHGPYIARELIIGQLWHYGFRLAAQYQFTPQRYVLEFNMVPMEQANAQDISGTTKKTETTDAPNTSNASKTSDTPDTPALIRISSRSSLVRYRMIGTSSQGYTYFGKKAARIFLEALEQKDAHSLKEALRTYEALIPTERIGDEYSAFSWFCRYLLESGDRQARMLDDIFTAEYFDFLAGEDFKLLKKYLRIKYDLALPDPEGAPFADIPDSGRIHDVVNEYTGSEVSFDRLNDWNEFIVFNNPNRESWEKTSEMLSFLNIREGESIADVGCGYGFFSFQFSRLAGKSGKVHALEINRDALDYVSRISDKYKLNIETSESRLNDVGLPENSADTLFLCSMMHAVYIASIEFVKDEFMESMKRALRPGGRLVVVDNSITAPPEVAYHGSGIAPELIVAQMKYYGFELADSRKFIPQRYVLIFQVTPK
jgi:ubiquinone/menaquinone biosynthesis C-methylase UbiE